MMNIGPQPPWLTMSGADNPVDVKLLDREAFLEYARTAFAAEHERFEGCEIKVGRYLTALTLLLGAALAGAGALKAKLGHVSVLSDWVFIVFFALAGVSALAAIVFSLLVLRVQSFPGLPIDDQMITFFVEGTEHPGLEQLARKYIEATREGRKTNESRYTHAQCAHGCICACFGCAAIAFGAYVVMP